MFNCAMCKEPIGPRIKPITAVVSTRPTAYRNVYDVEDEYGNFQEQKVDSTGWEIVEEIKVCPKDAAKHYGIPEPTPVPATKPPITFSEKPADPFRVALIALAIHTTLDKLNYDSKRAKQDCNIAVPGIKEFVDSNKDFIF